MRKRYLLLAVLSAGLLGACATRTHDTYEESATPIVTVDEGKDTYSVTPPSLIFKERKPVEIVWRVEPGRKLRFSEANGIVIDGEIKYTLQKVPHGRRGNARGGDAPPTTVTLVVDSKQDEIVNCRVRNGGLEFVCLNRHTRPGVFKYTIRLTDGKDDYVLDPMVANW